MDLDKAMKKVLLDLALLSHGSTTRLDANRTNNGPKSDRPRPPGENDPPHIRFARRYTAASTPHSKREVLLAAMKELGEWKRTRGPSEPLHGTVQWKRMVANSPNTGDELARVHGISRRTVQTYRKQYRTTKTYR